MKEAFWMAMWTFLLTDMLAFEHYSDVIMGAVASEITSFTIVYATIYSGADQRKHQSSASLAFVWGFHRWPVNSPHKWPIRRRHQEDPGSWSTFNWPIFPCDLNSMRILICSDTNCINVINPFSTTWYLQCIGLCKIQWQSDGQEWNLPNSQIPECTCAISHNAPFRTEMCTFLFWMEHCGIWNSCILGVCSEWSIVWYDRGAFWDLW